jgi:hypothetical protein
VTNSTSPTLQRQGLRAHRALNLLIRTIARPTARWSS